MQPDLSRWLDDFGPAYLKGAASAGADVRAGILSEITTSIAALAEQATILRENTAEWAKFSWSGHASPPRAATTYREHIVKLVHDQRPRLPEHINLHVSQVLHVGVTDSERSFLGIVITVRHPAVMIERYVVIEIPGIATMDASPLPAPHQKAMPWG